MVARAIWNGVVTFGLVSIPVKLFAATESKSISFRQIHVKCKTKIQEKRWCPHCEKEVDWDEIGKGYEYAKGKYMLVTSKDLESLPLPSKETIVVDSFVKLKEIDPIYFEKSYYLESEEGGARSFALFMNTLAERDMVGIGVVAIRSKERLCCLRPAGGKLVMDTLFYPDEIRIDLSAKMPHVKLSTQEKKMAANLIEMMEQPFDPENFKDHYREALQKVIDAKLEGVPVEEAETRRPATKDNVIDLTESLRRSIKQARAKSGKATTRTKRTRRTRRKAG